MTYAIRRENGDVLWFDAITEFGETYTAEVTKHPIATGGFITDHTTIDNLKFELRAVLSDADFNLHRPSQEGSTNLTDKQFVNDTQTEIPVRITQEGAKWRSFLPEVVSQFTSNTIPTVTVSPQSKVKIATAVRDELVTMQRSREKFTLVEFKGPLIARSWENCILTSLSFREDPDTGEGLFPDMSIEQVTFTDVKQVAVKVKNKGRQSGKVSKKPSSAGDDAAKEATSNASKNASDVSPYVYKNPLDVQR
jgi:hypothetical protein